MKITIIGTGYVGLVTGACLAEMGNHVMCVDTDAEKIRILESGGMPIHEPGLLEMVQRNRTAHRLQFTTDVVAAVNHHQAVAEAARRQRPAQPLRARADGVTRLRMKFSTSSRRKPASNSPTLAGPSSITD